MKYKYFSYQALKLLLIIEFLKWQLYSWHCNSWSLFLMVHYKHKMSYFYPYVRSQKCILGKVKSKTNQIWHSINETVELVLQGQNGGLSKATNDLYFGLWKRPFILEKETLHKVSKMLVKPKCVWKVTSLILGPTCFVLQTWAA